MNNHNNISDNHLNSQYKDNNSEIKNQTISSYKDEFQNLLKKEVEILNEKASKQQISNNLNKVYTIQETIKLLKASQITFSSPVLRQGENAVLFPNTINVIQGQAGAHKSRLAEYICSALMAKPDCEEQLLNFHKDDLLKKYSILYVDTGFPVQTAPSRSHYTAPSF